MHILKSKTPSQKRFTYTLTTKAEPLDVIVSADCLIPNCRLVKITTLHLSDYVTSYSLDIFLSEWVDLTGVFENGKEIDLFPIKYGKQNQSRIDLWISLCESSLFDFEAQKLKLAKEARRKYINAEVSKGEVIEEKEKYIKEMRKLGAIDWDSKEGSFFVFPDIPFLRF